MNFKIEFAEARERAAMAAGVQVGRECVSDVIGAAPWSHITVSGWNCSGSDHFPFAMTLSATITAAAAITTAVAASADSGGGQ